MEIVVCGRIKSLTVSGQANNLQANVTDWMSKQHSGVQSEEELSFKGSAADTHSA